MAQKVRYSGPMPHGDQGTVNHTVPWMQRLVREGATHPKVQKKALFLATQTGKHPIRACFEFVQSLPYKHDPLSFEMLQGAPFLLTESEEGRGNSDCDCRVILLNSLLESLQYKTRIVLVRGPGKKAFSHVYSEVFYDGSWIPCDTIFTHYTPGMEVDDTQKTKRTIVDSKKFSGVFLGLILIFLAGVFHG